MIKTIVQKTFKRPVRLDGAVGGESSRRVWLRHIRQHWPIYSLGIVSVIATNVTEAAMPKITQLLIDLFISGSDPTGKLYVLLSIVAVLLVVQFFGRIGWRVALGQQTHFVAAQMKSLVWDRSRFFPMRRLESDLSPGELMNVATSDVGTARFSFGFTLVGTTDFFFLLVLTVVAMLSIDVELTLWAMAILPALPLFLDKLARTESKRHEDSQSALSRLTDLAAQAVSTVRLQRVTQTGPFWEKKLLGVAEDYRLRRMNVVRASLAYIPVTGLAPLVSYVLLLLIGLKKVYAGQLTPGSFVAMQSYIFIIQGPMFELGTIISEWQRSFTSLDRLLNLLRQPEAENLRSGGKPVVVAQNVFQVEKLSFGFDGGSRDVIHDLSFSLNRGERLGIKGPIGAGKSTLVSILSGFERNFRGDVKLFGEDIRNYSHESVRNVMSIVHQRPFLFADTIRANLSLNRQATDEVLWRLLEVTCLHDDVSRFPDKLDTRLGEWGINLSGGQKQRMTLARALVGRPEILLLDDCLSAVDTLTEEKILLNLDSEMKDLTAVWVAHRSSTLRYCDKILTMGEETVRMSEETLS